MKKHLIILTLCVAAIVTSPAAIVFISINARTHTILIHQNNGPIIRLTNEVDFAAITNAINPAITNKVNP